MELAWGAMLRRNKAFWITDSLIHIDTKGPNLSRIRGQDMEELGQLTLIKKLINGTVLLFGITPLSSDRFPALRPKMRRLSLPFWIIPGNPLN
jgi:hypothetical protein